MNPELRTAKKMIALLIAGCVLGFFLFSVSPAFGGPTVFENALYADPTSQTYKLLILFEPAGLNTIGTPGVIAFNIIKIVLGMLGIVGVSVMIYAGFLWLTAGGEEEKAKQGRTLLFQALIGILIVLAAYTITYFVIDQLVTAVTKK